MNLTIYFKSGNKVKLDRIKTWSVGCNDGQISSISIEQEKRGFWGCKNRLIVKSVNLDAIECIIES